MAFIQLENDEDLREYVLKNLDTVCGLCLSSTPKSMLLDMNVDFKLALLDLYDVLFHFNHEFKVCFTCISSISKIVEFKAKMRALHGKTSNTDPVNQPIKFDKKTSKNKTFEECGLCGIKRENLPKHNKFYHSDILNSKLERKFQCDLCGFKLPTKVSMEFHMIILHTPNSGDRLTCKICKKTLKEQSNLSMHYKRHYMRNWEQKHSAAKPRLITCSKCGFKAIKSVLEKHKIEAHSKDFKKYSQTPKDLPNYNPIFHEDGEITCCGKKTPRQIFQYHKKIAHPEQIRKTTPHCKFCLKKFNSISELVAHRKNEHKNMETPTSCQICGISTKNLIGHQKSMHADLLDDQQECKICEKFFYGKKALKNHIKKEHIKPQLSENYDPKLIDGVWHCCGRTYATKELLNSHKVRMHPKFHKTVVSFCNICGLKIEGPNGLLRKHKTEAHRDEFLSKEKAVIEKTLPFDPKYLPDRTVFCCGFTFATSKLFHRHKESVHKDQIRKRTTYCRVCCLKFNSMTELKAHLRKVNHKKEDKEERICKVCSKKFNTLRNLFEHKKRMHPELIEGAYENLDFKCDLCDEKFRFKAILEWHMMSKHIKGGNKRIEKAMKTNEPRLIQSFYICCGKPFTKKQFHSHYRHDHKSKQKPLAESSKNLPFAPKHLGEGAFMCCGKIMETPRFKRHKLAFHKDLVPT